jgi:hypothetical protein
MRISVLALLTTLALAGCGPDPRLDQAAAFQACQIPRDFVPPLNMDQRVCLGSHYRRQQAALEAQDAQTDTDSEDAAAMVLLGGTAFVNGWNQGRHSPVATCYTTGMMTQCY